MLKIADLTVAVEEKIIINNLSGVINSGQVVACLGQNGSGKSSLLQAMAGHPVYEIAAGSLDFNNQAITQLSPDKRARLGLFLVQQYPQALPGVSLKTLLKESFRALYPEKQFEELKKRIKTACQLLELDEQFLERDVNVGLSGGQKKRSELLQVLVLQPKLVLLDEIDSGLDVDALKLVGKALQYFIAHNPQSSILLVTHYQTILEYVMPDTVWVMHDGRLVQQGDNSLAKQVLCGGYEQFLQ